MTAFQAQVEQELRDMTKLDEGGQEQGGDGEEKLGLKWQDATAYTDKVKISLARAFVVNPEVLVLHRPLQALYNNTRDSLVMTAITAHVKQRGLCLPPDKMS